MAVYRVQGPDGQTYRIEGPDGASEQQVIEQAQALFQGGAPAGEQAGQKRSALANIGSGLKQGAADVIGAGVKYTGRGIDKVEKALGIVPDTPMADMVAGKQPGRHEARADAVIKKHADEYAAETAGSKIAPIARVGGQIAITAPLGSLPGVLVKGAGVAANMPRLAAAGEILAAQGTMGTLPQRMASGAVSSAAVAPVVEAANGHEPTLAGAGGAAVVGALIPAAVAGIGKVVRGKAPPVTQSQAAAQPAAQGAQGAAQGAQGMAQQANAAGVAERQAAFDAIGVKPAGPMLTRDPQDWRSMMELSKREGTGAQVVSKFQEVDKALQDALAGLKGGIDTPSPGVTGETVANALGQIDSTLKARTNAAYEAVKAHPDIKNGVSLDGVKAFVAENRHQWGAAPEWQTANRWIKQNTQELANGKASSVPIDKVESLRKDLGAAMQSADPTRRRTAQQLIERLDEAVFSASPSPIFADARAAHQIRKATTADQGIIEDILAMSGKVDRKVPYEKVWQKIVGGDVAGLKQVKNTLETHGQAQAWQALKAQTIDHLLEKAAGNGSGAVAYAQLDRALKALGKERMDVLFSPAERKMLDHIRVAAQAAKQDVAYSAVNHSNTASNLVNALTKMSGLPGVGGPIAPVAAVARAVHGARQAGRDQRLAEALLKGGAQSMSQKAAKRYASGSRAAMAKALQRIPASAAVPIVDR